jgi:ABC-2 type transport system permease protein
MLGLDLGLVTLAAGAATGSRSIAVGVGSTVAAVSYLLGSLAPVVSFLHPLRVISVFYWAVGDDQISHGVTPIDYAVPLAVAAGALCAAAVAFARLDIR